VSLFARRVPFLEKLFPSSGLEVASPQEVTDVVHLVHPWPGRTIGMQQWDTLQTSSTPNVTPFLIALSPAFGESWEEVLYADISHDSATARTLQLAIRDNTGQSTFIGRWSNVPSVLTAGLGGFVPLFVAPSVAAPAAATVWAGPMRPLIIAPGRQLVVFGDTAGAAYSITLSIVRVIHTMHDVPLMY